MEDEFDFEEETKSSFGRKLFFLIILIIGLSVVYARYIGTTGLVLKEYTVKDENLGDKFIGYKIAHFSDFHYGRTTGLNDLKNLVKKINLTKPDIVVFTGDFFDDEFKIDINEIEKIKLELSKIKYVDGKYFITGNHDLKNENFVNMFEESGFKNLNDSYEIIYKENNNSILLAGINYKSTGEYLNELFKNNLPSYKIVMMHTPDSIDSLKQFNFNLALAGHSHNGQITLPIIGAIYTPEGARNYYDEYYKVDNTDFYISSGIGTSKYNFRLFNRPSFNLYRLKK